MPNLAHPTEVTEFNPLVFYSDLTKTGMPENQARVLTDDSQRKERKGQKLDFQLTQVATKGDIKDLQVAIEKQNTELHVALEKQSKDIHVALEKQNTKLAEQDAKLEKNQRKLLHWMIGLVVSLGIVLTSAMGSGFFYIIRMINELHNLPGLK